LAERRRPFGSATILSPMNPKHFVTEITVSAGTSFNHPFESYSNFKPAVTIKVAVASDEDPKPIIERYQQRAHDLVLAEKSRILRALEQEHYREEAEQTLARAELQLKGARQNIAAYNAKKEDEAVDDETKAYYASEADRAEKNAERIAKDVEYWTARRDALARGEVVGPADYQNIPF
jgi:hypothetical protein